MAPNAVTYRPEARTRHGATRHCLHAVAGLPIVAGLHAAAGRWQPDGLSRHSLLLGLPAVAGAGDAVFASRLATRHSDFLIATRVHSEIAVTPAPATKHFTLIATNSTPFRTPFFSENAPDPIGAITGSIPGPKMELPTHHRCLTLWSPTKPISPAPAERQPA